MIDQDAIIEILDDFDCGVISKSDAFNMICALFDDEAPKLSQEELDSIATESLKILNQSLKFAHEVNAEYSKS